MTNFFEIASDELTQDSFICWLLSNSEDKEIGNISKSFLDFLCGDHFDYSKVKITKITRQFKHIDIIVDYLVDGEPRLLIIEDKTNSSMHDDQLNNYYKEVSSWDKGKAKKRIVHYAYYKTGVVDEWEKKQLNHFKLFSLNEIYEFFENLETKSQIINDYKNYIVKMYKDRNEVSNSSLDLWTFDNWRTYFSKLVKDKYDKKVTCQLITYYGKYLSALIYFKDNSKFKHTTCLEIFFRKENTINATIHPVVIDGKPDAWKRDRNKAICDIIDSAELNKSFKHYSGNQTVATSRDKIKESEIEKVEDKLCEWINDYLSEFKKFNM